VVLNLLLNALDAMPRGGRLVVGLERDGPAQRGTLTVRDNGPGIPTEILPKIFQAYFTTKGAKHGTGLGLNIVQRLIKEAKGALHLKTRVGTGTTFTIYLPATPLAK